MNSYTDLAVDFIYGIGWRRARSTQEADFWPGSYGGALLGRVEQCDVTVRRDELSSRAGKFGTSGEREPDDYYQTHPSSQQTFWIGQNKSFYWWQLSTYLPRLWPSPKWAPSETLKLWCKSFLLWCAVTWFSERERWATEEKSLAGRGDGEEDGKEGDDGREHLESVCGHASGRRLLTGTLGTNQQSRSKANVSIFSEKCSATAQHILLCYSCPSISNQHGTQNKSSLIQ